MLTDKYGVSSSVLEGSDLLVCEDKCNLFQPKPTARIVKKTAQSADVQKQYWTREGSQFLIDNGFDSVNSFYEYLLLQHGLQRFSKTSR